MNLRASTAMVSMLMYFAVIRQRDCRVFRSGLLLESRFLLPDLPMGFFPSLLECCLGFL